MPALPDLAIEHTVDCAFVADAMDPEDEAIKPYPYKPEGTQGGEGQDHVSKGDVSGHQPDPKAESQDCEADQGSTPSERGIRFIGKDKFFWSIHFQAIYLYFT
ncbi:MAG: hypothetical protein GY847_22915 [Proteobacteria bacterium]|nr:hypothetical protein [Pseudomonadota bacterium]